MLLPKKYKIYENTPEKFHKYEGVPKGSYSQVDSFMDPLYRSGYMIQYFMECAYVSAGQPFANFGSACGTHIESRGIDLNNPPSPLLDEFSINVLENVPIEEGSKFEYETVIPFYNEDGSLRFCFQGYADVAVLDEEKKTAEVVDYKTGNTDKKIAKYASQEYRQTTLYSYYLASEEGYEITKSSVLLLGRKGNGLPKYPMRLSGENISIPTPYSEDRAKEALEWVEKGMEEIEKYYKVYLKLVA